MSFPRLPPRAARVATVAGWWCVGAGVLVLLFVAFQLWGTGLAHARAQDRLTDELTATFERYAPPPPAEPAEPAEPEPEPEPDPEPVVFDPAHGDPVARLRIPSIGVDQVVVHGVDVADLRLGPGHFPGTPLPGQAGNASIAGHRTTHGQPFHDLDQVPPGAEIQVETVYGTFTYIVSGHEIVTGRDTWVLDDAGDDRLTLIACHPKFSSRQRIVLTATLVDEPAPTPPPPEPTPDEPDVPDEPEVIDVGTGLGGDRDALGAVLAWGALFAACLAATLLAGRAWRRWPAYLLGAPVLAVVLFVTFGHLDRYLPAY